MANPVLQVEIRTQVGTRAVHKLRKEGKMPAVIYGHKEETLAISVPEKDFREAMQTGAKMFLIRCDDKEQNALLKETQYDTFGDNVLHADFIRVAMDEEVTVEVAIELRGTPVGVTQGGVLDQILRTVEVKCLPAAIPEKLTLDVSKLEIGDNLALKDTELPSGVKIVHDDLNITVAQVKMVVVKEEEAPVVEEEVVSGKEPEVIVKKAKEEEGEKEEKKS
ncbi:MAG: 50S ribosomal protein L25 [Candidatus Brocadiales bacterium]|nr:50S ribosomal protein L25 [Candidatus Bathyanammoxibius sp.]MCQ4574679.1 50S ribosomal protein L25 [Candidatus Bathyanammoxibius amoris]